MDPRPVAAPSWDLLAYAVAAARKPSAAHAKAEKLRPSLANTSAACVSCLLNLLYSCLKRDRVPLDRLLELISLTHIDVSLSI